MKESYALFSALNPKLEWWIDWPFSCAEWILLGETTNPHSFTSLMVRYVFPDIGIHGWEI